MKKPLFLVLLVAAVSLNAGAQVFDHLSLGAGTGLDGTSFELASPLGNHVQVRLGFGTAFGLGYTLKGDNGMYLPVHPQMEDSPGASVPVKLSLARKDVRLLFNIYPSKLGGFHFTLGTYLGNGSFFKGVMMDMPDDYNSYGLEMGNRKIVAINNQIRAELRAFGIGSPSFAVLPYAGIGFGRAVREDKRVTFSFDLGAAYQGKPSLWARSARSDGSPEYFDVTDNDEIDLQEMIEEYGQYMNFWPTINFHLYVRLF